MNHLYRLLILYCLFQLVSAEAFATHIIGGEITYRSLGNDKYEVNVKIYRDCGGVTLSNSPITVIPQCSASAFTSTLTKMSVTDITPVCSSVQSKCSGGSYQYGIEEFHYSDTIDLSSFTSCCSFVISWEQMSRNSAITTGQAAQNFYITAKLDKCILNSSVIFTGKPHVIICAGQDLVYNMGAVDTAEHDSLSFALDSAMQSLTQSATYGSAYRYYRPLAFLGNPNEKMTLPAGFHLDSITGDLRFRPVKVEIGVIVIKVTEWRNINGTMTNVGETRRDLQMIVTTCPNNKVPTMQGPYSFQVCANQQVCFDINSSDADVADSTFVTWNGGIPGASFTPAFPSTSIKQKATFCWTPTTNDISNTPHMFTAIVSDRACPINARATRSYSIKVSPQTGGTATRQINALGCGQYSFDATPSISGTYSYRWILQKGSSSAVVINQKNFTYAFNSDGTYIVKLSIWDNVNCPLEFTDTLEVDSFVNVVLPLPFTVCKGTSVQLTPSVSKGAPPYRYLWSTSPNDTLPTLNVTVTATTKYYVTVTDSFCSVTDSITVTGRGPANLSAGPDKQVCHSAGVQSLSGTPAGGSWSGPGVSANTFNPAVSGPGTFTLYYQYTDSSGCTGVDSILYTVNSVPLVSAGNDTLICANQQLKLNGTPLGGTWSGPGVSGNSFTPTQTGITTLYYSYTVASCTGIDEMEVDVKSLPAVNAGPDFSICSSASPVTLGGTPAGGTWSGTGVVNGKFDPATLSGQVAVNYRVTGAFGCENTDHIIITIKQAPYVDAGTNRTVCASKGLVALSGTPLGGVWSGTGVSGSQFDPQVAGAGIHNIKYEVADANGCTNEDFVLIAVVKPVADFTASPLSGQAPHTVNFNDISGGSYFRMWNFGDPSSSSNISTLPSTSHVYTKKGFYTVTLIIMDTSLAGCNDTLSKVNYIEVTDWGIGMADAAGNFGIKAYPNPAAGSFDVLVNMADASEYTLTMFDLAGKAVNTPLKVKNGTVNISCDDLGKGMYFLELSGSSGIYRTKIVLE
jgi:hypothetical protein